MGSPPSRFCNRGELCQIDDPVLPHPSELIDTPAKAVDWTLTHMERCLQDLVISTVETLKTYLANIVAHPNEIRYRQLRTAQRRFEREIWSTPARGILLAAGFVERGAFLELGS